MHPNSMGEDMSAFRNFEQAAERLEQAESTFRQAQARIESFGQASAIELNTLLTQFSKAGLFPEIDTSWHEASHLTPKQHRIAADRIDIRGANRMPGGNVSDDTNGSRIAEEIVNAARAQKVPVVHETNFGHNIQVSGHVKEREKGPEILLSALAAYAEQKGRPELAQSAREAAERMKTLVSSFREVE